MLTILLEAMPAGYRMFSPYEKPKTSYCAHAFITFMVLTPIE
jgi:hypothetical protein